MNDPRPGPERGKGGEPPPTDRQPQTGETGEQTETGEQRADGRTLSGEQRRADDPTLSGEQLAAISNAMTGLHRRYYGRGATKARTFQVHSELLLVELRDVYLTVERTLLERGQHNTVRSTRLTFQQAMYKEFVAAVEEIVNRRVRSFVSETIICPQVVLEIFYLESMAERRERLERERHEDAGEIPRPSPGIPQ